MYSAVLFANRCRDFPYDRVSPAPPILVLRSLKAVHKSATSVAWGTSRSTPHPRLGTTVQLLRRNLGRVFDLVSVCEGLSGKCLASEQTPPGLLQIQPAGTFRDKDLMHSRMRRQPLPNRLTCMTRQIVSDQIQLAFWVCGINRIQEPQITSRVTRACG